MAQIRNSCCVSNEANRVGKLYNALIYKGSGSSRRLLERRSKHLRVQIAAVGDPASTAWTGNLLLVTRTRCYTTPLERVVAGGAKVVEALLPHGRGHRVAAVCRWGTLSRSTAGGRARKDRPSQQRATA